MTAPLTPADCDLRGYGFMPLYGHYLFGSDFNAKVIDSAWRTAVTLWWAAWNQVPAGSLPNNEQALCKLADLGRDLKTWRKLKEHALHGFILCDDGRLYHTFLCSVAMDAWEKRVRDREKKAKWRAKQGDKDVPETGTDQGTETVKRPGHHRGRNGREGEGEGQREGQGEENTGSELPATQGGTELVETHVSPHKRATRLTEDWVLPESWAQWALRERKDWDEDTVRRAGIEFLNYWLGVPGIKGTNLNWERTWHNNVTRSPMKAKKSTGLSAAGNQTADSLKQLFSKNEH